MQTITISEAKERLRLPELARSLGIRGEIPERDGQTVQCFWPQRHSNGDRNPSFGFYDALTRFKCFGCGAQGDGPDMVADLLRLTEKEAIGEFLRMAGADMHQRPSASTARPTSKPEPPPALTEAVADNIHRARLRFMDALDDEADVVKEIATDLGVSLETLRWANFGGEGFGLASPTDWCKPWLCYAYSTGLKWRNPDKDGKPRFQWLAGRATAPWRIGWVKPETETVYLTESETDALALIECGIEQDNRNATVASPGTSFKPEWARLFAGHNVVLCFDMDPAGRAAAVKVAALLKPYAKSVSTWRGI